MLLDYLVASRGRRRLLSTLRSQGGRLTIRRLALTAGVAYSSAHREILAMRRVGLVKTERVGGALACSWDGGSPEAKALAPLLGQAKETRAGRYGDEALYGSLKRLGAPLVRRTRGGEELDLEETLGRSLGLARRDPTVTRVWPLVLAKNRTQVGLEELASHARRLGEKKALGFFLSLAGTLMGDSGVLAFAKTLRDRRYRTVEDFFVDTEGSPAGARARALAEKNTPRLAREWFFRMNMPLDSFESFFRKFVPRS